MEYSKHLHWNIRASFDEDLVRGIFGDAAQPLTPERAKALPLGSDVWCVRGSSVAHLALQWFLKPPVVREEANRLRTEELYRAHYWVPHHGQLVVDAWRPDNSIHSINAEVVPLQSPEPAPCLAWPEPAPGKPQTRLGHPFFKHGTGDPVYVFLR